MKVVIDIPEEFYDYLETIAKAEEEPLNCTERIILRGTVLKQGKWIDEADEIDAQFERHEYKCSECGRIANYYVGGYESWWDIYKPNYCPNCGIEMVGDTDGNS